MSSGQETRYSVTEFKILEPLGFGVIDGRKSGLSRGRYTQEDNELQ